MPPQPLWLALHLPHLPLEACAPSSSPSAVVERSRVVVCDDAARQAGIEIGTGVGAARALVPAIALIARSTAREAAAMHTLACWAGGFTPRLSLAPETLLLEISSCLRLFGGLEKLVHAIRTGMRAQNYTVATAAAPTPLGAQWLARSGASVYCLDTKTLHRHLEALSIAVLPDKLAASLGRFGAKTLADVRRLPSAALARRIGADTLQLLARAFGEIPDPRVDFIFPDRFALSLQLPASVDTAAGLLFAARRLTAALAGWLAARQAGIREFTLRLQHGREETPLLLQFADLNADGERFERILRERLERMPLHAPVVSLRLEAADVAFRPGYNLALFDDAKAAQDAVGGLFERLSARLGEQQVYRVALHADHRPEHATRQAALFEKITADEPTCSPRPLWLLDKPESLREVDGRPCHPTHGCLKLLAGPERIESGWWDGGEGGHTNTGDVRRDYFVALSANARWLWIYRDCRPPGGWFLQGFFS